MLIRLYLQALPKDLVGSPGRDRRSPGTSSSSSPGYSAAQGLGFSKEEQKSLGFNGALGVTSWTNPRDSKDPWVAAVGLRQTGDRLCGAGDFGGAVEQYRQSIEGWWHVLRAKDLPIEERRNVEENILICATKLSNALREKGEPSKAILAVRCAMQKDRRAAHIIA